MTDFAKLADLIEQGSGSRDRDADIYEAFGFQAHRQPVSRSSFAWRWFDQRDRRWYAMEHLTASVDECSRFIEKMRPDWAWSVSNIGPNDEPHACVTLGERHDCADLEGSAARPALALAAAMCRAECRQRGQ